MNAIAFLILQVSLNLTNDTVFVQELEVQPNEAGDIVLYVSCRVSEFVIKVIREGVTQTITHMVDMNQEYVKNPPPSRWA